MSKFLAFFLALSVLLFLFFVFFSEFYFKPILIASAIFALIANSIRVILSIITIWRSDDENKIYKAKLWFPRCFFGFIGGLCVLIYALVYYK